MKHRSHPNQKQRFLNMKNRALIFLLILMIATVFTSACKNDDEPSPELLRGSWTRTFTNDETYHAQLNLKETSWEWIILDTLLAHTNSFGKMELTGNQLRWFDNPDCDNDGRYTWTVSNNKLTLVVVDDPCQARVTGMTGTWDRLDTTAMHLLSDSWAKTMTIENMDYAVKLTMNTAGELLWEMIDPIPGHTNSEVSYTVLDNTIVIYNDSECGGNGYFRFEISGNTLSITTIKDSCPPRSPSFTGTWTKL